MSKVFSLRHKKNMQTLGFCKSEENVFHNIIISRASSSSKSFCASILVTESNMWKQTAQWSKLEIKMRVFKPSEWIFNIWKDWKFSH